MTVTDTLYSPIFTCTWQELCHDIVAHIEANRWSIRNLLPLDRPRPIGALSLFDMVDDYYTNMRTIFYRVEYPTKLQSTWFEFKGVFGLPANSPNFTIGFPYFIIDDILLYRSIEDANLVPNTYTHDYIFRTQQEADAALAFLISSYP